MSSPGPGPAAPRAGRVHGGATLWSGLSVIALETGVVTIFASHGELFADDFINFDQAQATGFSWSFLSTSVFGHFIPLFELTNFVLVRIAAYAHWLTATLLVVVYCALLLCLFRLLRRLIGPSSYWPTVAVAWVGSSLVLLPSLLWWSNGAGTLVIAWLNVVVVDHFLRYRSTQKPSDLVISVLALSVGLGFFDSMAIVFVEIVLISLVFAGRLGSTSPRIDGREARALLAYLVPCALDLGYRFAHSHQYVLPAAPTLAGALRYIEIAFGEAFLPAGIGVNYPRRLVLDSGALTIVLAGFALVVVIATSARSKDARRGWMFFALTTLVILSTTAFARIGYFGSGLGLDYDYLTLLPLLLVLGLTFAHAGGTRQRASRPPIRALEWSVPRRRVFRITGATACVALYLGALVPSALEIAHRSAAYTARAYFDTVAGSIETLSAEHKTFFLFDADVPAVIVPRVFAPYDLYSETIGKLFPDVVINRAHGSAYLVGRNGALVPARFVATARLKPRPRPVCVPARVGETTEHWDVLTQSGAATPVLELSYVAPRAATIQLVLQQGRPLTPGIGIDGVTTLEKGRATVYFNLEHAHFDKLNIIVEPRTAICISSVRLGRTAAVDARAR